MHAMQEVQAAPPSPVAEFEETVDFSMQSTTRKPDDLNTTPVHSIDELTWLNVSNSAEPTITLNATNSVYQVLMNTVSLHTVTSIDGFDKKRVA